MESMKKLSILLLAVASLAGCAEIPKGLQSLPMSKAISFNGMTLTETSAASFNLGRFQNLPRVRNMGDIAALDSAIMSYGDVQKRSARKGDWESMMTARHLGMLLVEYRAYVTNSSLEAIRSIGTNEEGSVVLTVPAGGYTVLPYKIGSNPVSSRASMEKALMQMMHASLNKKFERGEGVHVASGLQDIQQILKTINDIQQPIYRSPAGRSPGATSAASLPTLTDMVPMNQPFIVAEPNGKRYILERTEDAWVINNPSGADMKIQVEKLGYAPEFKGYDADRAAAVDLATRIEDQGIMLLADANRKNLAISGSCYTVKPGEFHCAGNKYRVEDDGRLVAANSPGNQDRSHERKPAYKLAMDLNGSWRFGEPVFSGFMNSCKNAFARPIASSKYGNGGELYTISCLDSGGAIRYSRQYYISFEKKRLVQTIGSVLADSKKRAAIEKALAPAKMAEGIAQFVPGLGIVDGLAQCAGANSITRNAYLALASSRVRDQARLDSFLGEPDSLGSRALNCLGGISVADDAIKAARWMSGWLNVSPKRGAALSSSLKGALNSDRMKKMEEIAGKFGNDWVSGKDITDTINAMKAGKVGAATLKMAETFHSAAQSGNSMNELAEAAIGVRDAI